MEITVITNKGGKEKCTYNPQLTTNDFFEDLGQKLGVVPQNIRLIYSGAEIKPGSATLKSFGIGKNDNWNVHAFIKEVSAPIGKPVAKSKSRSKEPKSITRSNSSAATEIIDMTSAPSSTHKRKAQIVNLVDNEDEDEDSGKAGPKEKRSRRFISNCSVAVKDRIERAQSQRLYLIEQKDMLEEGLDMDICPVVGREFAVLGSTGNVYDVRICKSPTCSCPDFQRGNLCKHILFVILKVLRVDPDSFLVYQKAFLSSEVASMLKNAPSINTRVRANNAVIKAYKEYIGDVEEEQDDDSSSTPELSSSTSSSSVAEDVECPICFEMISMKHGKEKIESCSVCRVQIHHDCIQRWQSRNENCPLCRSSWPDEDKDNNNPNASGESSRKEGYLNLGSMQGQSKKRDTSTYHHRRFS